MTAPIRRPPLAALLLAVAAAPWLIGAGNELQDVDSAQYADVARLIAQDNAWLKLRDSTGPFVNKPPLAIWAQAVAIEALGPTSLAARLPSLLFALLAIAATFGLGRALLDPTRGAIAACLLAASVALQQMVSDPKVDLALTAMATASLWAFVEGRKRPGFLWLGWVFAGLAVLSKGPLGLALPAAAIAPEAIRHRWGGAQQGTLLQRVLGLKPLRGLLIVAAIAAPYYWAVYQRDGADGARFVLWQQNIGRLFGQSGYANDTTPLFFLHTALWVFLPFTPLLLIAFARPRLPRLPSEQRVLWWGFWIPFAAFSLSTYKLPQYIYCLAPVGALIAADAACGLSARASHRARVAMAALGGLGAGLLVWLLVAGFPPPGALGTALGIGLALGLPAGAWAIARRWDPAWQLTSAAVGALAGLHLVYAGWLFPQATAFQAGQRLAERARAEDPAAPLLPFVDTQPTFAVAYYRGARTALIGVDELASHVRAGTLSTVVVNAGAWPDFASVGLRAEPIAKFPAYPTSRPKLDFLRASTRPAQLQWRELVRLKAP
ncbi:MAG: hypothetical protein H6Q89_1430 [Myxococcaceae bacterium]|nr:hypothetical protein [Myxococcaceae bacterium]